MRTPSTTTRRMAAVVLNHRTPEDTRVAVSSLLASSRRPDLVIVVDNDVSDEGRPGLAPHDIPSQVPRVQGPEVISVTTGHNLGFSGGMNAGIRVALEAGVDTVVLVNSDLVVSPDCLDRLEAALVDRPDGGIVGPLVLARTRPERIECAGLSYNRRTGRMRVIDEGGSRAAASPATRTVDAISGCLMLITRSVFDTIGLFDERFFYGFEDLDLCLRAHGAGLPTLLAGSAVAYHEGGRTIGRTSPRRYYFGARNHLFVASRRDPTEPQSVRARRLLWVTALNVAHALTAADSAPLSARLISTARGVRDHLRGRYGPDPAAQ